MFFCSESDEGSSSGGDASQSKESGDSEASQSKESEDDEEDDNGSSCSCQNDGVCDLDGKCVCTGGFSGELCEISPPVSSCGCLNGGTCDEYEECVCPSGFEGIKCEINIDDCLYVTCYNFGTCIDGIDSFTCLCPPPYYGDFCELAQNY